MSKMKPFKRHTGSALGLKTSSGYHSLPSSDKVDVGLCEGHDHLVSKKYVIPQCEMSFKSIVRGIQHLARYRD